MLFLKILECLRIVKECMTCTLTGSGSCLGSSSFLTNGHLYS